MKRKLVLLVLLIGFGALGWTFVKRPLSVPPGALPELPRAVGVPDVALSVIHTADLSSQHGFSVRGGDLTQPFSSAVVAILVEHPKGRILLDAGMAKDMVGHFDISAAPLMRALAEMTPATSTAAQLRAHDVDPASLAGVLITHVHWDHISGTEDLPGVPVWITAADQVFARSGHEAVVLYEHIAEKTPLDVRELKFNDGPYGPFASSHDHFGDGSVVAVPMPGHTPGSLAVFVTVSPEQRYFFIGDTAWTSEGVAWPAERPWLARRMVDDDPAGVRAQLVLLHQIQQQHPALKIIPAHDARMHATIAAFPHRTTAD